MDLTLDECKKVNKVAKFYNNGEPVLVRLFIGQLPTHTPAPIKTALDAVLLPQGIQVLLVDVLKESRKGNCAKIVVRKVDAQDVINLVNHRLKFTVKPQKSQNPKDPKCRHEEVDTLDVLPLPDPTAGCVTCEPERSQL